ncbi:MAG TPA: response regulator [Planctomycetota bacterium]|jgi:CheY-like chemotaxis protein
MQIPKIAVVEDNVDNRLLLHAFLDGYYHLTDYEDGMSALHGLPVAIPDLVLLDISLPGIDGMGVLQQIRLTRALMHLPVIALTAHAMAGDRERLLAAGFDDYVSKPIVDENVLLLAIARLLERNRTAVPGRTYAEPVEGGFRVAVAS